MRIKNKIAIAVAASAMMCSASTFASAGNVKFIASIMAATCNLTANQTTGVSSAAPNIINFGTISSTTPTVSADFVLKPAAGAANQTNCNNIFAATPGGLGLTQADVTWSGVFDTTGNNFVNNAGTASAATLSIANNGSTSTGTSVTSSNNTLPFVAADYTADGGFKHAATLNVNSSVGTFDTTLAYVINYH
ncbi:hypothetical protein [Escherichia coli]|uniref:hypothetical protein n=1 Tax=Escherichia coli TaxID=562 RepID=UPI003F8C7C33